nr:PREDICTED: PDZ domain-containing protein 8 [Latimeria chalumnae]|eukprot:XP_005995794.1 PREDICTED: PDZ domain-containing protein 8 [Latimeria chalumnae]
MILCWQIEYCCDDDVNSILVELIKGNSQSVGLTFRQIQASDGDAGHVCIETVTPNSPAAVADLQRGDRLIAIGGTKVTSSVQVLKLIKQAGDRVMVYYERPVGHQNQHGSESFGQLEDTGYMLQSCPQSYEEDTVSITNLDSGDGKDVDSEFEELVCEVKPTNEFKEEPLPTVTQSPKRSVATLAVKPLGTISPILNRKLNLVNYPAPLKPQQKEGAKPTQYKGSEHQEGTPQPNKTSQGSTNKPPVPPRPHIKPNLASSESQCVLETGDTFVEKTEKTPTPSSNGEKSAEKTSAKNIDLIEDLGTSKTCTSKQEAVKDKISESSCSTKDSMEDRQTWESSEIPYRNRYGKWNKATCLFEVENHHKYLNVALWCKDPFKVGDLICLGHISIKLEEVALECLSTSSMEYQTTFRLNAPEPKAVVSRTALRILSTHKGFNEKLCYGDITLNFTYLKEGESENSSFVIEKERECNVQEEVPVFQKEEPNLGQMFFMENKHNFQDTQFQNPTWCDHCKKKVWTKAASQCMLCAYVCHKKCQEKCLAENPFCVATERRVDFESKSTINRTTGLTRHILNTSSRLLNLRQAPKARLAEQGAEAVEPSPKHTPNTSDNESSDTETYSGSSPSKRATSTGIKLARKEGGLDDSVFIAVKEIGRDLYRGLSTEERSQKLEFMLDKLQNEIDQELEHNNLLLKEEKGATDARKKSLLCAALSKSSERLQALTLLVIHYRAGIEDLESLESMSSDQQSRKTRCSEESSLTTDVYENEVPNQMDTQTFNNIPDEQIFDESFS